MPTTGQQHPKNNRIDFCRFRQANVSLLGHDHRTRQRRSFAGGRRPAPNSLSTLTGIRRLIFPSTGLIGATKRPTFAHLRIRRPLPLPAPRSHVPAPAETAALEHGRRPVLSIRGRPMSDVPEKLNVLWFLPTHGDGRYLGTATGGRQVDYAYLKQIAIAADSLGYYGVLIPTGRSCEDSWLVASSLISVTEKLKFLVAVRPGLQPPTPAARMTSTLDRLSGGRLLVNVVTGGDPAENKGDGIWLDHAERYEVTEEFLDIYKRVLAGESVDFEGKHLHVEDARLSFPPVQRPHPPLFFGGSSEAAHDVAAKTIDKYLTWGEPPADVAAKIKDVRARAKALGREVSFGIRLHVIVRETSAEAWKAADDLI
eukprot:gene22766-24018_t